MLEEPTERLDQLTYCPICWRGITKPYTARYVLISISPHDRQRIGVHRACFDEKQKKESDYAQYSREQANSGIVSRSVR